MRRKYSIVLTCSRLTGFIFTTSLPPAQVAGAIKSIQIQKESKIERQLQQLHTISLKEKLAAVDIPVVPGVSAVCLTAYRSSLMS